MKRLVSIVVLLLALGAGVVGARADSPVALGSLNDVVQAIDGAREQVELSAWTLDPREKIVGSLERAAQRGVDVRVTLTSVGFQSVLADNQRMESALARAGIHINSVARPIHLKGLVVDHGATVALDDTNWGSQGTVLFLAPGEAATIENAIRGRPHDEPPLTLTKAMSLKMEGALLTRATHTVRVETESFGPNNDVSRALERDVARGVAVTLIVAEAEFKTDAGERSYIEQLHRKGVTILVQAGTRKGAVIDDVVAWIGSTNSTMGQDDQLDWGFASADPTFVRAIADATGK